LKDWVFKRYVEHIPVFGMRSTEGFKIDFTSNHSTMQENSR